jgi:hypothetical protein
MLPCINNTLCSSVFIITVLFVRAQPARPSITVYSVNLYTETVIAISCDRFMDQFSKQMDTTVYYSTDSLRAIDNFLQSVRYSTNGGHVDTRVQFDIVNSAGKTIKICMGKFNLYVNDHVVRKNVAFFAYMRSLLPKKQLGLR